MGAVYAARIRAARGYAGISQQELAEALGVDVQTVKRRESPAGNDPKKGERLAIAAACDVPPEFMEGGFPAVMSREAHQQLDEVLEEVRQLREEVSRLASRPGEDAAQAAEAAGRRRQQRRSAPDAPGPPHWLEGREG